MDYNDCIRDWFSINLTKDKQKEIKNTIKNQLVESGKFDTWRNCMFAQNSKLKAELYGTEIFKKYEVYLGVENTLNSVELRCCKQIYDSNRKRNSRLKNKLEYRLNNFNCLFLTMTFTDEVLNKTSHDTRRTYISRFLKDLGVPFYVANIDYGDKEKNPDSKEREHYHAIIQSDWIDLYKYPYGFIYAEEIRNSSNVVCLTKYVNKLTCHAYKDSTKGRDRLIYSR